jgi:hypothetical protein
MENFMVDIVVRVVKTFYIMDFVFLSKFSENITYHDVICWAALINNRKCYGCGWKT